MREVVVLGVGLHPYGKFDDKPLTHMYRDVVEAALKDAGVEWRQIEAVAAAGSRHSGGHGWGVNGNEIVETMGLTGVPVYNLMAGCAASGYAFNVGYNLVATGIHDLVLVAAGEKMPKGFIRTSAVEDTRDAQYVSQVAIGMPGPAGWAMMTRRRMVDQGTTEDTLAKIVVKAHRNGAHNPYARFRQQFTLEDVYNSPMVVDPLRLYEICPVSDGAAAVILASADEARKRTTSPVWLAGCGVATTHFGGAGGLAARVGPTNIHHTEVYGAVTKAFAQASVTPKDVDFIELQDNVVTYELIYPEEWGFLEPGEADLLVQHGETGPEGRLPINPSGGFNTFGEATTTMGLFQICEATWQLRGQKGATQVPDAKVGLTQLIGLGGNGTSCILKR